ncbi:UBAC2 [Bugula neritina]|uniref:UBAC2 n=1 Tax=Bugula neritina TaxID=10212 RepID=A0A7J7JZC2_BUGNE|nr:UBAC2 [Bugula neritina]
MDNNYEMFSNGHSISSIFTGVFYKAPLCRAIIYGSIGSYLMISFPLQKYKQLFECNCQDIFFNRQIWRLPVSRLAFTEVKYLFLCIILMFQFKKFEKRYGTRKFAGHVLGVFVLTQVLEFLMLYSAHKLEYQLDSLPSGPIAVIFSFLIPFYLDLPRITRASFIGIPITGKSFSYITALQVSSSSIPALLCSCIGLVAGVLHRKNVFRVRSWARVPVCVSRVLHRFLGPLLDVSAPALPKNYGATLELQRIEQEERLEQTMLLANIQQHRSQLLSNRIRDQRSQWSGAPPNLAQDPPDDLIQTLVGCGFTQERASEALRLNNSNLNLALDYLIQVQASAPPGTT